MIFRHLSKEDEEAYIECENILPTPTILLWRSYVEVCDMNSSMMNRNSLQRLVRFVHLVASLIE